MEAVFKALADPTRRALLDLLAEQDGRTLSNLEGHFQMSRFGTMKHIKLLEEAGLITTQKVGREKYHYLNPVPIQLVYDRWVSKYARPVTQSLSELKFTLEERMQETPPAHVYAIIIRTSPERLWQAITDPDFTRQYYHGSRVQSDWKSGSPYQYLDPTDAALIQGEVLESDPPTHLKMTFQPMFIPGDTPPSVVTYRIEPQGELCTLTLTHEGLDVSNPAVQGITSGWTLILSGLKTLLETGEPLSTTR